VNDSKQGFYDYSRINYVYRLPLIEPYEIKSPDNGATWVMDFKNPNPPSKMGVQFLTQVGIKDSIIVVYAKNDYSYSSDHPELWTVVNAAGQSENIFLSKQEYENYLKSQNAGNITLYEINGVYELFDTENKLPDGWGNQPKNK
jgi:hypothetical protein